MKKNIQQAGVDTNKPNAGGLNLTKDLGDVKKGEHKDLLKNALAKW